MKHCIIILLLSLSLLSRSLAIEPGVYLVSSVEIPEDKTLANIPTDAYMLTISEEGVATLAFASDEEVKFDEVKVIEVDGSRHFVLHATFTEGEEYSSMITIEFIGSKGKGVLVGARRSKYLAARIGKLN